MKNKEFYVRNYGYKFSNWLEEFVYPNDYKDNLTMKELRKAANEYPLELQEFIDNIVRAYSKS